MGQIKKLLEMDYEDWSLSLDDDYQATEYQQQRALKQQLHFYELNKNGK